MLFGTGLRGEGNILHHLRPCGYRLTHVQSRLHEFDFAVQSLAADLGDGMRLCKLAEKLTGASGDAQPFEAKAKVHCTGISAMWQIEELAS